MTRQFRRKKWGKNGLNFGKIPHSQGFSNKNGAEITLFWLQVMEKVCSVEPGFIWPDMGKVGEKGEPKAILVVSRNFMHWKSSFSSTQQQESSKRFEDFKINTTVNQMQQQQHPSVRSSIQFLKDRRSKQKNKSNFCLCIFAKKERKGISSKGFENVVKKGELRLWQVDCPVKSWVWRGPITE